MGTAYVVSGDLGRRGISVDIVSLVWGRGFAQTPTLLFILGQRRLKVCLVEALFNDI